MSAYSGVKFVLITLPQFQLADTALRATYEIYAGHLQDPFYAAEMPIRSETFDKKVEKVMKTWN